MQTAIGQLALHAGLSHTILSGHSRRGSPPGHPEVGEACLAPTFNSEPSSKKACSMGMSISANHDSPSFSSRFVYWLLQCFDGYRATVYRPNPQFMSVD